MEISQTNILTKDEVNRSPDQSKGEAKQYLKKI